MLIIVMILVAVTLIFILIIMITVAEEIVLRCVITVIMEKDNNFKSGFISNNIKTFATNLGK